MHKTEVLLKWTVIYLKNEITLWHPMIIISTKWNLTGPWIQCVSTHCLNMCYHTGKVCLIVVNIVHTLLHQFRNKIRITHGHVLIFFHVHKVVSRCTVHWILPPKTTTYMLCYATTKLTTAEKYIHKERYCNDGDTSNWISHKFIHNSNTKAIISCAICTHYWDSSD